MSRGHRALTAAIRDTQPGRSQSRHHPQIKGAKRVDEDQGAKAKESVPFDRPSEDEGETKESVPFGRGGADAGDSRRSLSPSSPLRSGRSLSPSVVPFSHCPLQRRCSSGEEADCPHYGTEGVCPLEREGTASSSRRRSSSSAWTAAARRPWAMKSSSSCGRSCRMAAASVQRAILAGGSRS